MTDKHETRRDSDTEMNTGVSDHDTPSPLQAEGEYLTSDAPGRDTVADTGSAADSDTEMNTGVSDSDSPSPLQAEGTYLTGEDRHAAAATDVDTDTEMNTGVSDTDTPSPLQADGTYLTGDAPGRDPDPDPLR